MIATQNATGDTRRCTEAEDGGSDSEAGDETGSGPGASERASGEDGQDGQDGEDAPSRFVAVAGGGRRWSRQEIKKRNGAGLSRPKEERRQSWCVGTDAESGKFDVSRGCSTCSECSEMQRDAAAGFSEMHRDEQTGSVMGVWLLL